MHHRLRPAVPADLEWLVELRAQVMRPDLERLGVFDPVRVRERLRAGFDARCTRIIMVPAGGTGIPDLPGPAIEHEPASTGAPVAMRDVGSIAVREAEDGAWIEHFYLAAPLQGRGLGGRVFARVVEENSDRTLRVNVLRGSAARRLYERHGFVLERAEGVDLYLVRSRG